MRVHNAVRRRRDYVSVLQPSHFGLLRLARYRQRLCQNGSYAKKRQGRPKGAFGNAVNKKERDTCAAAPYMYLFSCLASYSCRGQEEEEEEQYAKQQKEA